MKNSVLLLFFSSVFLSLANWFQITMVAKYTTNWQLGTFTLSLAITNPIYQLFSLQLRPILVSDRKENFTFNEYFSLRVYSIIISIIVSLGIAAFFENTLSFYFIILLVAFSAGIDAAIDIFNAKQHHNGQFKIISFSAGIRSIVIILGCLIGLFLFKSLIFSLFLICILKILSFRFYDYYYWKKLVSSELTIMYSKNIYSLLKLSLPLGINLFIASLNINISKYIVNYFYGIELQGVYSTISYLIVLGTMFVSAIGQFLLPKLSHYVSNNCWVEFNKFFRLFIFMTGLVGACLFIISIFGGKEILKICFNEEIAEYSYLFTYIMFSSIFVYLVSANTFCLTALRIFIIQPMICLASLIINIISSLILYYYYGIIGIILATGIAFAIQFLLGLIIIRKNIRTITIRQ